MAIVRSRRLLQVMVLLFFLQDSSSDQPRPLRRVCYFTNWSCDLMVKEAYFCQQDLDPSLCSHLVYAFAGINVTSLGLTPTRVDDVPVRDVKGGYAKFNDLKQKHPSLQTFISIGGNNQAEKFKTVTSSASSRGLFAENIVRYVREWGFDGVDLDWEYPGESEKQALTLLIQDLRAAFRNEATETGQQMLLLSLAAPVGEERVHLGYQVDLISRDVDMINLMAYDFYYGAWDLTALNSPLFSRRHPVFSEKHSVEWIVKLWMRLGAPAHKINLGMAAYGQSFTLRLHPRDKSGHVHYSHDLRQTDPTLENFLEKHASDLFTNTNNISIKINSNGSSVLPNSEVHFNRTELTDPIATECSFSNSTDCGQRNLSGLSYIQASLPRSGNASSDLESTTQNVSLDTKATIEDFSDPAVLGDVVLKETRISRYGVGSKSTGPGKPGRLRHLKGQLSFPEICEMIQAGAEVAWDEEQKVPFLVLGDQWVGFDNAKSVAEKVRWAHQQHLGGVMFWSLDLDDFRGTYCEQGPFPLLSAMSRAALTVHLTDNEVSLTNTVTTTQVSLTNTVTTTQVNFTTSLTTSQTPHGPQGTASAASTTSQTSAVLHANNQATVTRSDNFKNLNKTKAAHVENSTVVRMGAHAQLENRENSSNNGESTNLSRPRDVTGTTGIVNLNPHDTLGNSSIQNISRFTIINLNNSTTQTPQSHDWSISKSKTITNTLPRELSSQSPNLNIDTGLLPVSSTDRSPDFVPEEPIDGDANNFYYYVAVSADDRPLPRTTISPNVAATTSVEKSKSEQGGKKRKRNKKRLYGSSSWRILTETSMIMYIVLLISLL